MLKLYITRHGETEWNVEGRMQGWKNSSLTQKGIKSAKALGERLKEVDFKFIYSSSSQRAVHTAELIRGNRNIQIITDENLREINLGDWEGKRKDEFSESDEEGLDAFWNRPHQYKASSGEDFFQVRTRIEAVLNKLISENSDGNILIVTHAVIVKTLMAIFRNLPMEKLWGQPFIHGTGLCLIEIDNTKGVDSYKASILLEGDLSHISE